MFYSQSAATARGIFWEKEVPQSEWERNAVQTYWGDGLSGEDMVPKQKDKMEAEL